MLGVRAGASSKEVGFGVRGRSFMMASTSHSSVDRVSSLTRREDSSVSNARRIFFVDRISLSQTPAMCDACGGKKFHFIDGFLC